MDDLEREEYEKRINILIEEKQALEILKEEAIQKYNNLAEQYNSLLLDVDATKNQDYMIGFEDGHQAGLEELDEKILPDIFAEIRYQSNKNKLKPVAKIIDEIERKRTSQKIEKEMKPTYLN